MARYQPTSKALLFLLVFILVWFTSCRTSKEIPTADAKAISTAKLLKSVEKNAFDYDYFSVKRINCQFSSKKR